MQKWFVPVRSKLQRVDEARLRATIDANEGVRVGQVDTEDGTLALVLEVMAASSDEAKALARAAVEAVASGPAAGWDVEDPPTWE